MASTEIEKTLSERTAAAERMFADALRVEIAAFVSRHLEDRLRSRPHFAARTPNIAWQQMRVGLERLILELPERAARPIVDLRIFLGATSRSEAEEAQALLGTLSFVVDATRELLTTWLLPGDDAPDRAEDTGVDLDAEYRLPLVLSPNLVWAWRTLRGVDTARNQRADGAAPGTLEVRFWLPEALPEDPT